MIKRALLGGLAALLLSGCGGASDAAKSLKVKLAQDPQLTYALDIAFENAPGPPSRIRAEAFYRADNIPCAKPLPFSGAVLPPEHRLELTLEKVGDARYRAEFHRDALIDEDYFGIGVCRWQLQNVAVRFSSPATDFVAHLSVPQSGPAQIREEHFFLNRDYAEKPEPATIVFGEKDGFYRPEMGQQFKVTLAAQRQ